MKRSFAWVLAHPDPDVTEVPRWFRRLWLKRAEEALPNPVTREVFSLYLCGRILAELTRHPDSDGVVITGIEPDAELIGTTFPPANCVEIPARAVKDDFATWVQKLALSLVHDETELSISIGPLFSFRSSHKILVSRRTSRAADGPRSP